MNQPRIGSLFSGVGGLDMGVMDVLGGSVAWHVEFDPAPSKILKHHWPDVPNYGDVTKVDWAAVERVYILTAGFPCQDVSLAGARKGMRDGTRSGLWSEVARAIDVLRPQLVLIENVRGLLSATAGDSKEWTDEEISDLESEAGSVGGLGWGDRPVLRALGAVLGDLADLGYDTEWVGLRAADAGAPHNRFRIFIVAHSRSYEPERWGGAGNVGGAQATGEADREERERVRNTVGDSGSTTPDPAGSGRDGRTREPVRYAGERITAPRTSENTTTNTDRPGRIEHGGAVAVRPEHATTEHRSATNWGDYGPAIERWELVTGAPAPSPTNPDGKNGSHRLAAQFVEWMMGLPAGHVTDPVIGLTRNQQLKALGNGVVPQQAALALRYLLTQRVEVAA